MRTARVTGSVSPRGACQAGRAAWRPTAPAPAILAILVILAVLRPGEACAATWVPVAPSESLGAEVGPDEREAYHLFPGLAGFKGARFFASGDGSYRLEYEFEDDAGPHRKSTGISAKVWDLLRQHVELVERHAGRETMGPTADAAEIHYRLALKYAARARYEVSRPLLDDLLAEYAGSPVAGDARATRAAVDRLVGTGRGLYLPGSLIDRSGRADLLVFAGYYGLWTGIALPAFLEADSPQAYAAGLLVAPAASVLLASTLSRGAPMGEGRASVISLGGELGTWQGIGWSAVGDADGKDVVGIGLLCGLVGIAGASALTHRVHFTEGHGALTSSALHWGSWFGLVAGAVTGAEDEELLVATLVGMDALVLATAVGARDAQMSKGRARLISLVGILGAAFGFGVDLLTKVDDARAAFGIAGAGSLGGLLLGAHMTRDHDRGKTFAMSLPSDGEARWRLAPEVTLRASGDIPGKMVPCLGVRARF